jgi:hypothetical protein
MWEGAKISVLILRSDQEGSFPCEKPKELETLCLLNEAEAAA